MKIEIKINEPAKDDGKILCSEITEAGVYKDEDDGTYLVVLVPNDEGPGLHDALYITACGTLEHYVPASWSNYRLTPTKHNLKVILEA